MAYGDKEEKTYGQISIPRTLGSPGHDTSRLFGYYILHAGWIVVSLVFGYFSYDLIRTGKGMDSSADVTTAILKFSGAAATFFGVAGFVIAVLAIRNLKIKMTNTRN